MAKLIIYLLTLALAVSINILLGTYNSVFNKKIEFDKIKLFSGIWKATVISYAFLGLSFIVDTVPIAIDGYQIDPKLLLITAIGLYTKKSYDNLKDILKVDKVIEKPIEKPVEKPVEEIVVIER